jgi:hypothetical protein
MLARDISSLSLASIIRPLFVANQAWLIDPMEDNSRSAFVFVGIINL